MKDKIDFMEYFEQYLISLTKEEKPTVLDCDIYGDRIVKLSKSFSFLTRFETDNDFKYQINIDEVFKQALFYQESYHEDTDEYTKLIQKIPALKNLKNYETYSTEILDENLALCSHQEIYTREDRIIKHHSKLFPMNGSTRKNPFMAGPLLNISVFKKLKGVIMKPNEMIIPKTYYYYFEKDNKDKPPCDVKILIENNKTYFFREDGLDDETFPGFFNDRLFKIYSKDGEITNYENFDYFETIKQIRHCIAHDSLTQYRLPPNQIIWTAQIHIKKEDGSSNKYLLVMHNNWFSHLIDLRPQISNSYYRFISMPKLTAPILNETALDEVINNSSILHFALDEYGSTSDSFKTFVEKYIKKYNEDKNIKKKISEFIGPIVEKFYEGFRLEVYNLENKEIFKHRLICDKQFFNLKPGKQTILQQQIEILEDLVNNFYPDILNIDEVFTAQNYLFPTTQTPYFIKYFISAFIEFSSIRKNNLLKPVKGRNPELIVAYCQFLIFYRLVYNNLYDFWKTIDSSQTFNVEYYDTKEGQARLKIQELDMSKFSIKNKSKVSVPSSFSDKALALRLLRNSVSHGSTRFSIDKNGDYLSSTLHLTSLENPNLSVSIKCKHLISFLNQPFFKTEINESGINEIAFEDFEKTILEQFKNN